jgi:hypothetical protein
MTTETKPTLPQMLRITGANTNQFMEQVALHVEQLEMEVARLTELVTKLENANVQ